MKFIRDNIPNFITCLNLLCGLLAIYLAFNEQLHIAAFFILGAAVLDFCDGFVARALNSHSKIGEDLDSLADLVSFGAAPAFILIHLKHFYYFEVTDASWWVTGNSIWDSKVIYFMPLLIAIFSAIRLAKFNNDTRQTTSFIGLPTPANGLLIASLPLIAMYQKEVFPAFITAPQFMVGFSLLSSILLVSPLPLFSLKFKNWGLKGNEVRYIFLLLSVILIAVFWFASIPLIIGLYIVLSLIYNVSQKPLQ